MTAFLVVVLVALVVALVVTFLVLAVVVRHSELLRLMHADDRATITDLLNRLASRSLPEYVQWSQPDSAAVPEGEYQFDETGLMDFEVISHGDQA